MPIKTESKEKSVLVHLMPLANKRLEQYCRTFNVSKSSAINMIIVNYTTKLKEDSQIK